MSRKIEKGFSQVYRSLLSVTVTWISHVKTVKVRADGYGDMPGAGLNRISIEGVMMRETGKLKLNKTGSGARAIFTRFLGAFPFSRRPILPSIYIKYLVNSYRFKKDMDLELGVNRLMTKSASTHPERRSERFYKVRLERPHAHATLNLARDDLEASYVFA